MAGPADHEDLHSELERYVEHRDVACPSCEYNLRGLRGHHCPECGQPLSLGVQLTEPYLKAWITLITLLAVTSGWSIIFLLILFDREFDLASLYRRDEELTIAGLMSVVALAAIPVAIKFRRRLMRAPRRRQWKLAAVSLVYGICVYGLVALEIL